LVLDACTAFIAEACPNAKGMFSVAQVSASQYQVCMHSQPTSRSGRNGSTALRNGSGLAGRLQESRSVPAASRTHTERVLACRSTPTYDAAVAGRNRMVKTPGGGETGTFNSIHPLHLTRPRSLFRVAGLLVVAAESYRGRAGELCVRPFRQR